MYIRLLEHTKDLFHVQIKKMNANVRIFRKKTNIGIWHEYESYP